MRKKILTLISAILFFTLACNLGSTKPETVTTNSIATSVAQTLEASGQSQPQAEPPTLLPTMTPPPLASPTLAFTPTITLTPTPSVPMVSVSVNTNCRVGPGEIYDYIGALLTGESAEVVGIYGSGDYWVINNPDTNGKCWLWGYYATVVGNTANLQEYAAPPTPTPVIPAPPSDLVATKNCVVDVLPKYKLTLSLSWKDNSDNEDEFNTYQDGVKLSSFGANQTSSGDFSVEAQDGVPIEFGVAASNTTGESSSAVTQVVCP